MSGNFSSPNPPPSFPSPQYVQCAHPSELLFTLHLHRPSPSIMQPTTTGSPHVQGSQAQNLSVPPVTTTTPSGATCPNLTIPPGPGGASGPPSAATSSLTLHRPATVASSNAGRDYKAERKKLCDALKDAGGEIPVSLGFLITPHSTDLSQALNEDDDTWTVIRSWPLVRSGSKGKNSWIDLLGVLTEKYCTWLCSLPLLRPDFVLVFLLKEETDPQGTTRWCLAEKVSVTTTCIS